MTAPRDDVPLAAERIAVAFAGASGDYPLTWSQEAVHRLNERLATNASKFDVHAAAPIRGIDSIENVLAAVRAVMHRHESLRTTFYTSTEGRVRQAVAGHGAVEVTIYRTTADQVDTSTDAVLADLRGRSFDNGNLPVRAAVLTVSDMPVRVFVSLAHLVADAPSASVVLGELVRLSRDPDLRLPDATQISDVVRYETSDRGQRQARRANEYWRRQLNTAQHTIFPIRETDTGASQEGVLESAAVAVAVRVLAKRYGTSEAAVALATFGVLVAAWSRRHVGTFHLVCANRSRPVTPSSVGNFIQTVPVSFPLTGDFGEVCRSAMASSMIGYRFGHYDTAQRLRTRHEVRRERGVEPDLSCLVNLWSPTSGADDVQPGHDASLADANPSAVESLLARTRFRWTSPTAHLAASLHLATWHRSGTARIGIGGSTGLFTQDEVRLAHYAVEWMMVTAACADEAVDVSELMADAALPRPNREAEDLVDIDGGWVDLARVRDLLAAAVPVLACQVDLVGVSGAAPRLEAFLAPRDPGLTPTAVHDACVRRLHGTRLVMAPHWYTICAQPPSQSTEPAAWRSIPVLDSGAGR
jgi:hypothetical protein